MKFTVRKIATDFFFHLRSNERYLASKNTKYFPLKQTTTRRHRRSEKCTQNWKCERRTTAKQAARQTNIFICLFFVDAPNEWKRFDIIFTRIVRQSERETKTATTPKKIKFHRHIVVDPMCKNWKRFVMGNYRMKFVSRNNFLICPPCDGFSCASLTFFFWFGVVKNWESCPTNFWLQAAKSGYFMLCPIHTTE